MLRILIGGSPCTYWSIAQTKGRETEPSGMGWELFLNFLIALEKYKPDYFLYENNKSMSKAIRAEITERFGFEPVCINSALVSAQSRQRIYWVGRRDPITGRYLPVPVVQPADRGIILQDILETSVAEPVNITADGKGQRLRATYYKDGIRNLVGNSVDRKTCVAEPIRVCNIDGGGQGNRIYSVAGKSCAITAQSGGLGGHGQGLYAIPTKAKGTDGKTYPIYQVKDGLITIKDKRYPIKLPDGYYIIRKLTVTECKRLQTVPETYIFPVSDTQAYKMLGNGWTVDVIYHIMSYFEGITTQPVEVLSMYDGMSCGHIALDKLGTNVARYYATEIDKYAIQTTQHNYPETIQLGDAFQVRWEGWPLREEVRP